MVLKGNLYTLYTDRHVIIGVKRTCFFNTLFLLRLLSEIFYSNGRFDPIRIVVPPLMTFLFIYFLYLFKILLQSAV